jgi:hypothetical protein
MENLVKMMRGGEDVWKVSPGVGVNGCVDV